MRWHFPLASECSSEGNLAVSSYSCISRMLWSLDKIPVCELFRDHTVPPSPSQDFSVTLSNSKKYENITKPKENKFYTGERDVPLMGGNITAANSTFFCILVLFFMYLGIFYLAGNIYSVQVYFNMTCCCYYFSFISLIPKEIFFTNHIFVFLSLSSLSFSFFLCSSTCWKC